MQASVFNFDGIIYGKQQVAGPLQHLPQIEGGLPFPAHRFWPQRWARRSELQARAHGTRTKVTLTEEFDAFYKYDTLSKEDKEVGQYSRELCNSWHSYVELLMLPAPSPLANLWALAVTRLAFSITFPMAHPRTHWVAMTIASLNSTFWWLASTADHAAVLDRISSASLTLSSWSPPGRLMRCFATDSDPKWCPKII